MEEEAGDEGADEDGGGELPEEGEADVGEEEAVLAVADAEDGEGARQGEEETGEHAWKGKVRENRMEKKVMFKIF